MKLELKPGRIYIFHFPWQRSTIGVRLEEAGHVTAAIAVCGPRALPLMDRDPFSRRIGRLIVTGRLSCKRGRINNRWRQTPQEFERELERYRSLEAMIKRNMPSARPKGQKASS